MIPKPANHEIGFGDVGALNAPTSPTKTVTLPLGVGDQSSLVHLDTDLGGDIDDLCALALLLRWPGLRLNAVTTVGDDRGRRAGYTRYVLDLAGRGEVPVASGADQSGGYYPYALGLPPEEVYWPEPVPALFTPVDAALELLKKSIERGATVIGIGPYTNLYLLDLKYPGILLRANLYLMGGSIFPTRPGFPEWGSDMDFNIQVDVRSARHVLENSNPTLIPLTVTVETALRRAYLPGLRASGPLGALIARQAVPFAEEYQNEARFGETCPGLPADTINFQHDPLACAIALGWRDGIQIQDLPLRFEQEGSLLAERIDPAGKHYPVVTAVDGPRFSQFWYERVARAD
jgi:purine nucleosidase